MTNSKFLYLTKLEWVETWVNGGRVPLALASSYLSSERVGTSTPDETIVHETNMPIEVARELYHPLLTAFGGMPSEFRHFTMAGCVVNGVELPTFSGSYYFEDGLVLCLSTSLRGRIMRKLGKAACVRIRDVDALKSVIDSQVGVVSEMSECRYIREHYRNAFVKSVEDEWMHEFRLFWRGAQPQEIEIPPGTAERVNL